MRWRCRDRGNRRGYRGASVQDVETDAVVVRLVQVGAVVLRARPRTTRIGLPGWPLMTARELGPCQHLRRV